jgi:hypothetical protein
MSAFCNTVLAVLLLTAVPPTPAQATYTQIDVPGAVYTIALGVDDAGDVVGYASDSAYSRFFQPGFHLDERRKWGDNAGCLAVCMDGAEHCVACSEVSPRGGSFEILSAQFSLRAPFCRNVYTGELADACAGSA